jgi:hypothetical protein
MIVSDAELDRLACGESVSRVHDSSAVVNVIERSERELADARSLHARALNRERVRRYRERLQPELRPTIDEHVVQQPPVIAPRDVPIHQERAIHAFLDRLLSAADDIFECSTCLERYQGMSLRGTQCQRCFHEVHSLLSCASFFSLALTLSLLSTVNIAITT